MTMMKNSKILAIAAIVSAICFTSVAAVSAAGKNVPSTTSAQALCKKLDAAWPLYYKGETKPIPRALSLCKQQFDEVRTTLDNAKLTDAQALDVIVTVMLPMQKSLAGAKTVKDKKKIVDNAAAKLKNYGATKVAIQKFTQGGYNYASGKTATK